MATENSVGNNEGVLAKEPELPLPHTKESSQMPQNHYQNNGNKSKKLPKETKRN